jgi:hypothetical protein
MPDIQRLKILLEQARSYVIMARILRSISYMREAQKCVSLYKKESGDVTKMTNVLQFHERSARELRIAKEAA